jgi:altronate hydrolase
MMNTFLKIHPADNMVVALQKLVKGTRIKVREEEIELVDDVPAKHKFSLITLKPGDEAYMYGVLVGKAVSHIVKGSLMTTKNLEHAASPFTLGNRKTEWHLPEVAKYRQKQFMGYHRSNGTVGTANYWLVIPMVFCENRNVEALKDAMTQTLGYDKGSYYRQFAQKLISRVEQGATSNEILEITDQETTEHLAAIAPRVFKNIDGIKFLTHEMGCGGTRSDAQALCGLLAGYITHPNVAGATVLSLGCQNAQVGMLQQEIQNRDHGFSKPLIVLEQQQEGSEKALMQKALKQTIAGLTEANKLVRKAAPLSKLCVGLECGGSDGFSGISANPAVGHTADMIVALGGKVILSEFPELCGVEQELSDRCLEETSAIRFNTLMKTYNRRAEETGSGFYANPSPGNIRDGLITDAIKSAGAAKKGGSSPVVEYWTTRRW